MTKKMLTMMAALLLSGSAIAAPVDATSAKQKAAAFLQKQAKRSNNSRRAAALRNPQLTEAQAFGNALHVFNVGQDNGFVIVSGDDRTEEIVGYVENGSFDMNNIPDNMRFWLQAVSDQIANGAAASKAPRRTERAAVAPVVTTQWDQPDPFNNYILEEDHPQWQYYHNNLMTGCVATSMAQAIYRAAKNYKEKHGAWPSIATHTIPAYTNSQSGTTTYNVNFPELPEFVFDWENMREDNYSTLLYTDITEEQIKAVGKLMQYCGRAMKMEYDKVNSASIFVYVAPRLYDCLNLSQFVRSVDREYYTSEEWEDMMYKEVSKGRAVCYSSNVGPATNSEGHAFILDGYKDGLFHINWGWGKSITDFSGNPKADGYFSLSIMQPMVTGSGGASAAEAEYKYLQQAVINISYEDPEDVNPALNFYWEFLQKKKENLRPTEGAENIYGTFGVYNVYGAELDWDVAWAIRNNDGSINIVSKDSYITHETYGSLGGKTWSYQYFNSTSMNLPTEDGIYDFVLASRIHGTDTWYACHGTEEQFVRVTIDGGIATKTEVHPVKYTNDQFSVTDVQLIGTMEANKENTVRVTINNTGDDFFGNVALYYSPSETDMNATGSGNITQFGTVKPGESKHDFTVKLPTGEYNLWVFVNPSSYPLDSQAIGSGYKMYIGMGNLNQVEVGNLQFEGQVDADPITIRSVNGTLDEIKGSFDVKNDMTTTYSNIYYIAIEKGTGSSKTQYAKQRVDVAAPANATTPYEFTINGITGLQSGETYKVRLFSVVDNIEVDATSKNMTLNSYFKYWKAGDTYDVTKEGNTPDANALAIDYRFIATQKKASNANCLYYLNTANSSLGTNTIVNGTAGSITINGDNAFYAPEAFTATEINFSKTFTGGNVKNGAPYWETIVLPFEVNNVKQGTKNLKWFKSATDKRCHFWLMELTNVTSDALTFDYAQQFNANTPYIIQVPGEGWGDNWNLVGKELVFKGLNVTVPVTALDANATFVGTFAPITVSGLILNPTTNKFEPNNAGSVAAYNAYIKSDNNTAKRIVIVGDDIATAIGDIEAEENGNNAIYDLQGRRVQNPKKGLYIVNGKTVVIK